MGEEVLFAVKEKSYFGFRTNYYLDSDYTVKHRLNGPAVEWDDGSYCYYVNGDYHRLGRVTGR